MAAMAEGPELATAEHEPRAGDWFSGTNMTVACSGFL
jgi:hypothetical protein